MSLEDAEDHELVDGAHAPLARVEQPEMERGLSRRVAVLLLRHRADVRRQGHVEPRAGCEEAFKIGVSGLGHARLSGRGEVDAAEPVLRAPLELDDGRVDVPERELGQTEAAAAGGGAEVGEPAVVHPAADAGEVPRLRKRDAVPQRVHEVERHRLTIQTVVEDDTTGDAVAVHVAHPRVRVVVTGGLAVPPTPRPVLVGEGAHLEELVVRLAPLGNEVVVGGEVLLRAVRQQVVRVRADVGVGREHEDPIVASAGQRAARRQASTVDPIATTSSRTRSSISWMRDAPSAGFANPQRSWR